MYDTNILHAVKGLGLLAKPTGAKVFFFDGSPNSNKFPHLRPPDKPGQADHPELMQAHNALLKNHASELSHYYCSVDVFVVSAHNTFKNLGSYADFARYSNGRLYYYPGYDGTKHGIKLDTEFTSVLTSKVCWEGVGRVRVSSNYH